MQPDGVGVSADEVVGIPLAHGDARLPVVLDAVLLAHGVGGAQAVVHAAAAVVEDAVAAQEVAHRAASGVDAAARASTPLDQATRRHLARVADDQGHVERRVVDPVVVEEAIVIVERLAVVGVEDHDPAAVDVGLLDAAGPVDRARRPGATTRS